MDKKWLINKLKIDLRVYEQKMDSELKKKK